MKIVRIISNILAAVSKILVFIGGVNMIFSYIETLKHREVPEGGSYYVWKYGKVFYHKRGTGAPVIVLHGFEPEQSGKDVDSLSRHLASNHTVYRIDLLGFGLSDKPWFTYTNYLYVLLIQNFIKEVVGDISDIIACGGSGLCALQAYKSDPSMIGKIVLVDPVYEEPVAVKGNAGTMLKKLIDIPILGTFIYNVYSLTGAAPFDKEGRHVFTSRLAGFLKSDLTEHEDLITDNVAIMNRSSKRSSFTFGDVKSSLI